MKFEELGLAETLLRAAAGKAIPLPPRSRPPRFRPILEGRDVLGCAQTGTGKTAAFALPTLQRLGRRPAQSGGRRKIRTLVLAPTRELAIQIGESFQAYGRFTGLRRAVVYGGVGQNPQVRALQAGVDVLIATPGRLMDLMQQGFIDLAHVEILILDEGDRMLDMGFIHDLRRIVAKVPSGGRRCCFLPPCRPPFANWPINGSPNRSTSMSIRWPARPTRSGSRWSLSIRRTRSACSRIGCKTPLGRVRWSSPAPSIGPTRWPSC